jgi:hypothetical protein
VLQLKKVFAVFMERFQLLEDEVPEFGLSETKPAVVKVGIRPQNSDHHKVLIGAEKVEFFE